MKRLGAVIIAATIGLSSIHLPVVNAGKGNMMDNKILAQTASGRCNDGL